MKKTRELTLLLVVGVAMSVLMTGSLVASTFGDVTINGFGHQSYIETDTNTYVVDDATEGSYQDMTVGLTFTAKPSDKVALKAQVVQRDGEIKLDWGFGQYQINEYFGVKAGKMKLPFGFYTELLPVKALHPFSFLPGVYDYGVNAVMGFGVFGNYEFENGWGVSADLYNGYFPAPEFAGSLDDFMGGQLWVTPPVQGLRVGAGYFQTDLNIPIYGMETPLEFLMFSSEYVGDKLFVRGEYSPVKAYDEKSQTTYYLEAGYLVHPMIQPVVRFSSWKDELFEEMAANFDLVTGRDMMGRPRLTETETAIALGVNFFPASGIAIKGEYHIFDGNSSFYPGNQDPLSLMNPSPDEKWNMFAFSLAFMF